MSLFTVSQTWYYLSKTLKCPFWKYNANTTLLYMKAFGRFCQVIKFKLIAVAVILWCEKTTLGPCSDARVWNTTYFKSIYMNRISLTHWGRDKMDATSQTTLSNAFSLNENVRISIKNSLKFVPKGSINNIPALVQIMAWRRLGDKPLFEPMIVSLSTHICVTRPQWVNSNQCNHFVYTHWGHVTHTCVSKLD